jgi:hypothetical protein
MVIEIVVESDSRAARLRRDEVTKTLDAISARAERDDKIELGVLRVFETENDEVENVAPFTRSAIRDEIFANGLRADTTRVTIVAKTPISPRAGCSESGSRFRVRARVTQRIGAGEPIHSVRNRL